jgi:hypothetical protein
MRHIFLGIFCFVGFSIGLIGQVNPLSKVNCNTGSDSVLVKYYLDSLNKSIEPGDQTSYSQGKFYYSPENYFKVLVISGQSCGMYCNPEYFSRVFYEKANRLIIAPVYLSNIESIYELENKNPHSKEFLLIDETWCRPRSVEGGNEMSFTHLRFDDTVSVVQIRMLEEEQGQQIVFSFAVYSGSSCEKEQIEKKVKDAPVLNYDPKTKMISYMYFEYLENDGTCRQVTGTFKYTDGKFVQQSESFDPKEEDEDK